MIIKTDFFHLVYNRKLVHWAVYIVVKNEGYVCVNGKLQQDLQQIHIRHVFLTKNLLWIDGKKGMKIVIRFFEHEKCVYLCVCLCVCIVMCVCVWSCICVCVFVCERESLFVEKNEIRVIEQYKNSWVPISLSPEFCSIMIIRNSHQIVLSLPKGSQSFSILTFLEKKTIIFNVSM